MTGYSDLTLQLLLSASFVEDGLRRKYHDACALVIGAVGTHPSEDDWSRITSDITRGLVICFSILTSQKSVRPAFFHP